MSDCALSSCTTWLCCWLKCAEEKSWEEDPPPFCACDEQKRNTHIWKTQSKKKGSKQTPAHKLKQQYTMNSESAGYQDQPPFSKETRSMERARAGGVWGWVWHSHFPIYRWWYYSISNLPYFLNLHFTVKATEVERGGSTWAPAEKKIRRPFLVLYMCDLFREKSPPNSFFMPTISCNITKN